MRSEIFKEWVLMFFLLQRVGEALASPILGRPASAEAATRRQAKVAPTRLPPGQGKVLSVDIS